MKIIKPFLIFLLLTLVLTNLKANHLLGASITYKSIGNNKYEIFIDCYRDCRGVPLSGPSLFLKNVNTGALSNASNGLKEYGVSKVTPTCKKVITCNPPNTIVGFGFEKHWYKATIDLTSWKNAGDCQILIGTGQCCRQNGITTGASAQNFWVWAMIDLCLGSGNSSVVFGEEPPLLMHCNMPVKYNPAAYDYIDNDSLVYELINPMTNDSTKTSWSSGFSSQNPFTVYWPVGYDKKKGPNPTANPPIGFYFNNLTGDIILTPMSCSESTISALRVSEYRKDSSGKYKLIGYAARDIETIVQNSTYNNVPVISSNNAINIFDNIKTCFTVSTSDYAFIPPPPQKQIDNDTTLLTMFPFKPFQNISASFNIVDPKAKLKSAQVCWEPEGLERNQPYQMVLKVMDNNCDYYGFSHKAVNIRVQKNNNIAWIDGITYFDKNKNCSMDSNEMPLPNQKIIFGTGNYFIIESDSIGKFKKAIPAGNYTFKIYNKYGAFVCSKSINIVKGNSYKFNLGAAPKMHITGTVYKDSSKNCKYETAEPTWANQMVYTEPGNYITSTDSNGKYNFLIPAGEYKIKYKPAGANYFTKCVPPSVNSSIDTLFTNQNIAIYDSSNIIDVTSNISTAYTFSRGSNQEITVTVRNNGSETVNGTVWLKYNKKLKFVSANSYVSKTDSNVRWDITNLPAGNELRFYTVLNADASTCQLNDTMTLQSWLDTTGISKDINWSNNFDKHKIKITGKTDANIKQENLTNGYTWREANKLKYYIQFRNTGKKTINNIWVVDTLPFPIAGSSFAMLGASHAHTYSFNNNVLKVNFTGINVPDSASDKIKSFGYFEFSVEVDTKTNREIKFYNEADIYFDTAVAVQTNKVANTYTSYVSAGKTNVNAYCINDTLKVSFSSKFQFAAGNKFRLMISNSNGNFDNNSIAIDSMNSTTSYGTFKTKLNTLIAGGSNYKVKVVSSNPFSRELADGVSNSFKIYTSAFKPVISIKDTLVCGKDSITFTLTSLLDSVKIYDGKTLIATLDNVPTFKLKLTPGKHFLTASRLVSASCSITSDTLIIINDTIPLVDLKCTSHSNNYGCLGDIVTLKATNTYSYSFFDKAYKLLEQNTTGIYSKVFDYGINEILVIGKSKLGCVDTSTLFTIDMLGGLPPNIKFSDADLTICKGESVTITGSGWFATYQLYKNNKSWLSSFTSNIATTDIRDNDSIKIKGTDIYGCSDFSKSYGFKVIPLPVIKMTCTDIDLKLCDGVNGNQTTLNFTGALSYKLYKNGSFLRVVLDSSTSPYSIKDKDYFYSEGTNSYGCKNISNTITLRVVNANISFTVNKGGPVCDGDSIQFDFKGGLSYELYKNKVLWQNLNKQQFITRSMTQNDTVYAKGTDSFGCKATTLKYGFNIIKTPLISITNFNHPNNSHCEGEDVVILFSGVAKHDLYKNGTIWKAGLASSTTFNDLINKDEIYVTGIAANGCKGISNIIKFTVWPVPAKPVITRTSNDLYSNYTSGNQWSDESNIISGAINQKYSPTKFGNYFVKHTSVYGCVSPYSNKYNYSASIPKLDSPYFKIYPNPASDYIKIETGESGHYKIKLMDITGKLIKEDSFIGKNFEWYFKIGKGIYQIVISNEKGQVKTKSLEIN